MIIWLKNERKDARILTAVRRNILNRIVVDNKSDLKSYLYIIIVDVRRNDLINRELGRRIRIVNIYDQNLGREYIYLDGLKTIKRAI